MKKKNKNKYIIGLGIIKSSFWMFSDFQTKFITQEKMIGILKGILLYSYIKLLELNFLIKIIQFYHDILVIQLKKVYWRQIKI